MIEACAERIPHALAGRSGKVFYSGRTAFENPAPIYALGLNPGGDPTNYQVETIATHTNAVLHSLPSDWSAYRDESWEGAPPGTYGMGPRVLHLFKGLGYSVGHVPCSNLIFVRSRNERDLASDFSGLSDLCWPFHSFVIEALKPRAILCLGRTAGTYVRRRLNANSLCGEFVETNRRRWRSRVFQSDEGTKVIIVSHPSRADWTTRDADPTELVRMALQ